MSNTGFNAGCTAPIILSIDTSSSESSLAISSAENIIATLTIRDNRPHSQTLFSQISTLLQLAEIKIQDISAFAVATGPGSFTGLRVGLAATKGLADSLGKACLGVDSLDLQALASGLDGAHLVMIDAGRGEVYSGFRETASGEIIDRSVNDKVGEPASVLRTMIQYLRRPRLIITGDGGYKYKEKVFDFINKSQITDESIHETQRLVLLKQSLSISAVLARRGAYLIGKNQPSPVRPHYIRQSDAEIKWRP
ncbi:MAG: tRNA (adenosine(37)-N6)-threonylcarbamoyltransferase complex dimerization subunit type 1 TsaB [Nitrososphaerales archaeon]